jgi:hypothetical protein
LALYQATVTTDKKKCTDKQFFIVGSKGEKDMLVEAESAAEAIVWVDMINQHIDYVKQFRNTATCKFLLSPKKSSYLIYLHIIVDRGGSLFSSPSISNNVMDITSPTATTTTHSLAIPNTTTTTAATSSSSTFAISPILNTPNNNNNNFTSTAIEFPITPSPGFVIKVLRTNGEKIFINLCESIEVPMMNVSIGYSKWPFMILTPMRTIIDEKESTTSSNNNNNNNSATNVVEMSVYDAIVNPAVITTCQKNAEHKDAACSRVLRLLKKQYGEDLQDEYKLPKINKVNKTNDFFLFIFIIFYNFYHIYILFNLFYKLINLLLVLCINVAI